MYEPYTWQTGEVITADKLNNLEQGVEGNALKLNTLEQKVATVLPQNETGTDAVLMSAIDDGETVVGWTPMGLLPFPLYIGEGIDDGDTLDADVLAKLNSVVANGGIAYLRYGVDGNPVYFYLSSIETVSESSGTAFFESSSRNNSEYYFEISLDTGAVTRKGGII